MIRSLLRGGLGPAALVVMASSASAAFDVSFNYSIEIGHFGNATPHYNLFPGVAVTNFTDDAHPDNAWLLLSPNGTFEGNQSTSSSTNLNTIQDVLDEANSGAWSLAITDGATGDVRTFEFSVFIDAVLTAPDYPRALTITSHLPGDAASSSPTFEWAIDPNVSGNTDADYDSTIAFLNGPENSFGSLPATQTTWAPPAAPLDNGIYSLYVSTTNYGAPSDYIEIDTPVATDGLDELDDFSVNNYTLRAWHSVSGLDVPAPGALTLAGMGALIAARRRR